MLMKILMAIAAVGIVILAAAALQPGDYSVSRSVAISAPAADVFAHINNLHQMDAWSPWLKPDPDTKKIYEGPEAGTGAVFSWSGDGEVGEGRMTIVESQPNELIRLRMDFIKPLASTAIVEFHFKSEGHQTIVTQTMSGEKIFVSKIIGLFVSMDAMLGSQFEKGLATLKSKVESLPKSTLASSSDIVIVRTFDVAREKVWQAWTQPEHVMRWWGPKGFTAPVAKIDFKEGGKYLFAMRSVQGQDFWSTGAYTKIIPHELIELEDSFADAEGNIVPASQYGLAEDFPLKTKVALKFEELTEGQTLFTLTHTGIPSGDIHALTKTGWNESLDKLAQTLH